MAEELHNAFEGLGPEVKLEGIDPGDFEVGHEITDIYLGEEDGLLWYIDVRVERNILFRRFYIVRVYGRLKNASA